MSDETETVSDIRQTLHQNQQTNKQTNKHPDKHPDQTNKHSCVETFVPKTSIIQHLHSRDWLLIVVDLFNLIRGKSWHRFWLVLNVSITINV